MTGKWFKRFVTKCENNVPVAIDIYMDGWKVSNQRKAIGLYFTIANLDKSENWKVANKFPICLIPPTANLQHVLPKLLADVGYKLPPKEYTLSSYQGEKMMVKVEIARVIGDTPGIAEFCGVKNHRCAGTSNFNFISHFCNFDFDFLTLTFRLRLSDSDFPTLTFRLRLSNSDFPTPTFLLRLSNCDF